MTVIQNIKTCLPYYWILPALGQVRLLSDIRNTITPSLDIFPVGMKDRSLDRRLEEDVSSMIDQYSVAISIHTYIHTYTILRMRCSIASRSCGGFKFSACWKRWGSPRPTWLSIQRVPFIGRYLCMYVCMYCMHIFKSAHVGKRSSGGRGIVSASRSVFWRVGVNGANRFDWLVCS